VSLGTQLPAMTISSNSSRMKLTVPAGRRVVRWWGDRDVVTSCDWDYGLLRCDVFKAPV
jgi:hypothetical protein